ncbi:malectin domain-containing carbohydrate-binding protein [Maribacter polysaccharolyticus]|uniref:malectin domain-containing carbohydrate-binding protein n=1 Tax=Maribacter polysaccharolyticus TaxID=3020831 RepID=UPI00237F12E1|nr:malectin domain-containing carbohydrate-binding protein [Maribacter polysaccharolyticus]MDE3741493.1 malectin domain-containing carbohydrate-binding protein [Maribacter polysaccharolyticus]
MMDFYAFMHRPLSLYSTLVLMLLFFTKGTGQSFNASNVAGETIYNPTSMEFGPNDLLYVSQQNGLILEYGIVRDSAAPGSGTYSITNSSVIDLIKLGVPNHNDDGTINSSTSRQVTGLLTAGTSANPIIYVSSSDSRIGGGGPGTDSNLDTNSGVLSRLTWTGSNWDKVDLVRGLPRCEENHATNGMDSFELGGNTYILLQQGGNTNKGAPSNNFGGTQETYLSGALLIINITQLEQMEQANGGPYIDTRQGSVQYIYDLPTLNDPERQDIDNTNPEFPYAAGHPMYNATIDLGDPFGGNDGFNQAIVEVGGPVQIFSPGYRNAYDVVITTDGKIYTGDNGGNSSWGGVPVIYTSANVRKGDESTTTYDPESGDYITNELNESGSSTIGDALHYVGTIYDANRTYYGGHPSPIRSFPTRAGVIKHVFNGSDWIVESSYNFEDLLVGSSGYFNNSFNIADFPDDPRQGFFLAGDIGNPQVNILDVVSSSTNGICEYTATNFNGAMQGDILSTSFGGQINRYQLNTTGDGLEAKDNSFLVGFGDIPLDVIAQGDADIFPGTIWAVTYGSDNITVFEPTDFGNCPQVGDPDYDPLADSDLDGYTNADEIDNGTNHCSGGSKPNDNDGDFISDLNDPDDDNDGIPDVMDAFATDADNGTTTNLPINYPFWNNDPGTGFAGLGFTGWMTNGTTDYLNQYDPDNLSFGGAGGKATLDAVSDGDALGSLNNQDNGFQFGVNVDNTSPPFTVHAEVEDPFSGTPPEDFQSVGIYIGNGDQDNYLKVVIMDGITNSDGIDGFEVTVENNGTPTTTTFDVAGLLEATAVDLYVSIDPTANSAQPFYSLNGGTTVLSLGSAITLPNNFLDPSDNQGMAVGIIATSAGPAPEFTATWDFINITADQPSELSLDPDSIDFGTLAVSSGVSEMNITANNTGSPASGSIEITEITITGPDSSLFGTSTALPVQIGPGAELALPLNITPDNTAGTKNADMVITHTGTNSPTIVPITAELTNSIIRINSGGNQTTYTGNIFDEDQYFVGESIYQNTSNPSLPLIYQTERNDPSKTFAYNIPVPNGDYTVILHFAEIYWGAMGGASVGGIGNRVFDVDLEGSLILDNYDINADVGPDTPVTKSFETSVTDGELNIDFSSLSSDGGKDQPKISAIEVIGAGTQYPPITVEPIADQINQVDDMADLAVAASGGDPNENFTYSISDQPSGIDIEPTNGQIFGTIDASAITGGANGDGEHLVTVTVDKPSATSETTTFTWTVEPTPDPTYSLQMNTGGEQITFDGDTFDADQYFVGGLIHQNTSNPSLPQLYQTERYGTSGILSYAIPVTNGDYTVILHFAEIYWGAMGGASVGGIGNRVFDVDIEGAPVLDNYDIYADVGPDTPVTKSFITSVTDGELNIDFSSLSSDGGKDQPKISAIEVIGAGTQYPPITIEPIADQINQVDDMVDLAVAASGGDPNENFTYSISDQPSGVDIEPTNGQIFGSIDTSAITGGANGDGEHLVTVTVDKPGATFETITFTWTVEPTPDPTYSLQMNTGGEQITFDGDTFDADQYFDGGLIHQNTSNPSLPQLYQTERYGTSGILSYAIPVNNGDYTVILHFAEIYWGATGGPSGGVGRRIFDVDIEGAPVLDNYDIYADVGPDTPVTNSFITSVTDGELNIDFSSLSSDGGKDQPKISAIEVIGAGTQYSPITIEPIADQINQVDDMVDLAVAASGGDPNENFTYSISDQPSGVDIEPTNGQIFGSIDASAITGGANGDGEHLVTVTVDKPGATSETITFTWTVEPAPDPWIDLEENEDYTGRHECSFVQAGDKFYLMGGRENAKTLDIYDYESNSWTTLTDSAPFEFNHFQATEYQGLIWVIGAFKNNSYPNEAPADYIWAFDPVVQEWIQGPEIPSSRKRGAAGLVIYNDKFYIVAGNTIGHNGGYVPWFDEYDPATGIWTALDDAPRARDHFHATVIGNKLYVAGGRLSGGTGGTFKPVIPEVDVFDFSSGTWSSLPESENLPTPRAAPSVGNLNGKLVVMGGEVQNELVYGTNTDDALKITEEYNPETGIWTRLADMNYDRHGTQAIISGGGIFITAGSPDRGGGNQKNMESLGTSSPAGSPIIPSALNGPTNVQIDANSSINLDLDVSGGDQGIYIRSMQLTGTNASDFSIEFGELTNVLLKSNVQHTLVLAYNDTLNGAMANLVINHGATDQTIIPLEGVSDIVESGIEGFTLINADTDIDLFDLTEGMQIDINDVQGMGLNIRANTTPATVGSVYLSISGQINSSRTENAAPYAFFGDTNGNYYVRQMPSGNYTVNAIAYDGSNGTGTNLGSLTLQFSITDASTSKGSLLENNTEELSLPMQIDVLDPESEYLDIALYPNPTPSSFQISLSDPNVELSKILMFDMNGRLAKSVDAKPLKIGEGLYQVNASGLEDGVYHVNFSTIKGTVFGYELIIKK